LLSKCQHITAETKSEINADISRLSTKGHIDNGDVTLLGEVCNIEDEGGSEPMEESNHESEQMESSFIKQEIEKPSEEEQRS